MRNSTLALPSSPTDALLLTAEDQAGLQDFFQVYDAHYDEIMLDLFQSMDGDSNIEMMARLALPEQAVIQQRQARDLQRRAILAGDWTPYLGYLTEQGVRYAQDGQSFQNFFGRLGAFRGGTLPYLVEAYALAPDRLASALHGMNTLGDLVMGVVGQGYVETKEQLIRSQEDEFKDITTLQRAEDKFNGLLESAPDAMVIVNRDGQIVQANSQTETLFGYTRPDLVGRPVEILLAERFRGQQIVEPKVRHMGGGLELFAVRKDGSEFPAELSLSPIVTGDGILVIAAIRDITSRMKAEAKFRALLELAPDAIVILDQDRRVVMANKQMEKLFGYARGEIMGAGIDMFIPQELLDGQPAHRADFFSNPQTSPMEPGLDFYGVRRDGSQFPLEISLSPLETEDGLRVTATIRDATENRRLEHAKALRETNVELEAAIEELEAFSYSVSHDLRAPLRAVIGFSAAVLEDYGERLGADGQRQLGIIQSEARNMGTLVDDLLAFSRLGRQQMRQVDIDMAGLAQSVSEELARQSPDHSVSVQIGPLARARGDRAMLRQVWVNLLANAFKFTRPRPHATVEISSCATASEAIYSIKDNGVGFDMRYAPKLFDVFQRLHGMDEFEGTGIGLSIVKRVITRHGGRVWADGQVDAGATFYFALPLKEAPHERF